MPGVRAVVAHRDIPNLRYGALVKDQRLFVKEGEKVTFLGEVIAAVATSSLKIARARDKKDRGSVRSLLRRPESGGGAGA